MLNDIYILRSSDSYQTFEFESTWPKDIITKVVEYSETEAEGIYNLGFGDKDPLTGYIDDLVVTDNNDGKRVLATVASTLHIFTDVYPDAIVTAIGSTIARTRLYQMSIVNNLEVVEKEYIVLGYHNNDWEIFTRNTTYAAFLIRRKL